MNQPWLEHYDPGDLTIGVGAGCSLTEINQALNKHGQFLPVDPPHPELATVGGLLATAAHGPLRHSYGGLRDFCIGISFVTGDGIIAKGGGRVVKNVAGYDLMKLLIGSHGTLAVISSANFRSSDQLIASSNAGAATPQNSAPHQTKLARVASSAANRPRPNT